MENKTVFDFDGTLIRINSFPYWVLFLIGFSVWKFRFFVAIKVCILLIHREILKSISHVDFKKALMEIPFTKAYHKNFAIFLSRFARKKLLNELEILHQNGHKITITSAAPEFYLVEAVHYLFPEIYKDLVIVGAKVENHNLNGNHKIEKLSNLYTTGFIKEGENISHLYTDSWDDCEIAYIAHKVVLVSPSSSDEKKYKCSELTSKIQLF